MGPSGITNDDPVLSFGDSTRQMAILLSLGVVVGFCHGEYSANLVLKFVSSLWDDCAIEACQLVAEANERVVRVRQRNQCCCSIDRLD